MDDSFHLPDLYEMTDVQYIYLMRIIYDRAGINLGESKKELLSARLGKVLRRRGIQGFGEYLKLLKNDKTGKELILLLDAISTNVTHFFREENHFLFLAEQLARLKSSEKARIWSAGCSSGEEPYSIAITLLENFPQAPLFPPCILATDLSTKMLDLAIKGVYTLKSAQAMDAVLLKKYFLKGRRASEGLIRVKRVLSNMVAFERLNLMEPFGFFEEFRFIFCRNVMIYFDSPTRQELVGRFYQALEPGGYFIIGHSESLNGIRHSFEYLQPTIYRKM